MESFIEQNDILSPSQYGFRKAHSIQHAILDIVSTIQKKKIDKRLFSCGVLIKLKKAFDTVDHFNSFAQARKLWFSWCYK